VIGRSVGAADPAEEAAVVAAVAARFRDRQSEKYECEKECCDGLAHGYGL